MKKVILLLFLIALSAGTGKVLYWSKEGFSARRIHCLKQGICEGWSGEVEKILEQPFRYLGRGRQCFAFESEDGKYVLKLPRTDIYKTPLWLRVLPLKSRRQRRETEQSEREQFLLNSFQLAFHELKDQTGVIALHLGRSSGRGKKLKLIDKMGSRVYLPVEKTSFVLQYKHPILMRAFVAALERNDRAAARKILDALVEAIVERAGRGILNRDRSFLRNYGFDGKKAYQIDIGSFFKIDQMALEDLRKKSILDSIDPVQEWLARTDEEMLAYLNKRMVLVYHHLPCCDNHERK